MSELLAEALKLNDVEREEFAAQLLDSVEPTGTAIDAVTDEDLAVELDRRAEEVRRDPSAGIPWEQVRDMK
jgi:putative addiction module component (TIGR02574 family)